MSTAPHKPFDQAVADTICARISMGDTLKDILEGEGFPSQETVWRWTSNNAPFRLALARAREQQMRSWSDEIVRLSRDGRKDWVIVKDRKGNPLRDENGEIILQYHHDALPRMELQIRTMQWLMERLARHDFGNGPDRQAVTDLRDMPIKELFNQIIAAFEALGIEITEDQLRKIAEATGVEDD